MIRRRQLALGTVATLVVAVLVTLGARPAPVIGVAPGESVAAVAAAHPGAVLELAPGRHAPFVLDEAVTVRGTDGAVVDAPVVITADGARLEGLRVEGNGGGEGVTVDGADGVALAGLTIRGAQRHGIEVIAGSAAITDCDIAGLGAYGQGVEIRNAGGHPRSTVTGCRVDGGIEGLVTHVSRVEFVGNAVTGTTRRAIAIMEMSEALVEGNVVEDVTGAAIFCGDMSHCEIRGNVATGVRSDGAGIRSREGYGAVAWYYSSMRLRDNVFDVAAAEPVLVSDDSTLTDRFPLGIWPTGWRGMLPALPIGAAAVLGLLALRWAIVPALRRLPDRPTRSRERPLAVAALVGGFLVQTFHMVEHVIQVWQVEVADAEIRAGLLGSGLNTEWLHFGFNAGVLALLVLFWHHARGTGGSFRGAGAGAAWLGAAIVAQSYHVVEHTAKLVQHLQTGVKVAPGLFGDDLGLVWFHFAINLAVYAGTAVAAFALVGRSGLVDVRGRLVPTSQPQPT